MDQEVRARVGGPNRADVGRPDPGVHVTFTVPHVHRAADRLLDIRAEEHVRAEQDLGVVAVLAVDVLDDADRVGGGAAVVGLGLDVAVVFTYITTICAAWLGLPVAQ